MRIGELSDRSGVSTKTIRYYEEIGILADPERMPNGYRDYDETALHRLRFVRAAQAVGLTLGEIRQIIALRDRGETPCTHVADLLQSRIAELATRIRDLQRLRGELQVLADQAQELDPRDCAPERVCHLIGPTR